MQIREFCEIIQGNIIQQSKKNISGVINIYPVELFRYDVFFAMDSSKYSHLDGGYGNTCNEDSVWGLGGYQNTYTYIPNAVENGAETIVFDGDLREDYIFQGVNYIRVDDGMEALEKYAKYVLQQSGVKTIGVTGSTGKTTLSWAIKSLLETEYKAEIVEGIRTTYIGIIWYILHKMSRNADYLIIEMQSDGLGQIDRLCRVVPLDYAFIVNITEAHLLRFHTVANILQEKLGVYRGLKESGVLFIDTDNVYLSDWYKKQNDKRIVSICSNKPKECFTLSNIKLRDFVNTFSQKIFESKQSFELPDVVGRFQRFKGINGCLVVVDSYNASEVSTINGIDFLMRQGYSKKVIVLGSLLELAERTEQIHRNIGRYINSHCPMTRVILLGEATIYLADEINNPSIAVYHTFSYEKVIEYLKTIGVDKSTAIYFKGSGAMRMEIISLEVLAEKVNG